MRRKDIVEYVTFLEYMKRVPGPHSAASLSKAFNTYPATVKRWVEALEDKGVKFKKTRKREGARGFASVAWEIAK